MFGNVRAGPLSLSLSLYSVHAIGTYLRCLSSFKLLARASAVLFLLLLAKGFLPFSTPRLDPRGYGYLLFWLYRR